MNNSTIEVLEFPKTLAFISRYAVTELGKRRVLALLPFGNIDNAITEGSMVTEAKNLLIETEAPPFEELPDILEDISMSRVDGAVLSSKKLLAILRLAVCSRTVYQYVKQTSSLAPQIAESTQNLFVDKLFERHFSTVFDESGEVRDNASRDLQRIRSDIKEKNIELRKMVAKISKNLAEQDLLREEFLTLRDGRVVLPVTHRTNVFSFFYSKGVGFGKQPCENIFYG